MSMRVTHPVGLPRAVEWSLVGGDLQQLTLQLPRVLAEGTARVSIAFTYTLQKGLSGFYRSSFSSALLKLTNVS